MDFTQEHKDLMDKAIFILDSGWKPIFDPPNEIRYYLPKNQEGVVMFLCGSKSKGLNLEDAFKVQEMIYKFQQPPTETEEQFGERSER